MKKIISTLAFALIAVITIQQNQVNAETPIHLAFKGVPIDGTLRQYIVKMQQNGFTLMHIKDGTAILKGDFASYKKCIIGVSSLKKKDLVCKIAVIFPAWDTWSSLSSNYFSLKEMLTEKYGQPTDCTEIFQSSIKPEDDGAKMYEVKFDSCKYYTTYETDGGSIQLSIGHDGVVSCFVILVYYDKINCNIIKARAMGDI